MLDLRALDGGEHLRIAVVAAVEDLRRPRRVDISCPVISPMATLRRSIGSADEASPVARVEAPGRSHQPARTAPHPIDAEAEVQKRADDRREPRHADPADGRGHVALVDQNVDGDAGRDDEMQQAAKEADNRTSISARPASQIVGSAKCSNLTFPQDASTPRNP